MNLRILPLALHLTPEQALTLLELLDQLRELLLQAYGDEITAMLAKPPKLYIRPCRFVCRGSHRHKAK